MEAEKIVGYALLAMGLAFIIFPMWLAYMIFLTEIKVPKLVTTPTGAGDLFAVVMGAVVYFSNICLIFFIFIIMIWAGSIITSRGVTLIKALGQQRCLCSYP